MSARRPHSIPPVKLGHYPFGRLLAYVEFAGQDFNAALVELGFARVYTEGEAARL